MPGRFSLTVVVIVAAITWALALTADGWHLSLSFFGPTSIVVTVLVVASLVFDRWGWTLPLVDKIWRRPDLRGTWKGEFLSNYEGKEAPIEAYLSIEQTFSSLVITQFTQESTSHTRLASIQIGDGNLDFVVGIYQNEPDIKFRRRSGIHDGAFRLSVEPEALTGKYWTDRSTQGAMTFRRISRNKSASFQNARDGGIKES